MTLLLTAACGTTSGEGSSAAGNSGAEPAAEGTAAAGATVTTTGEPNSQGSGGSATGGSTFGASATASGASGSSPNAGGSSSTGGAGTGTGGLSTTGGVSSTSGATTGAGGSSSTGSAGTSAGGLSSAGSASTGEGDSNTTGGVNNTSGATAGEGGVPAGSGGAGGNDLGPGGAGMAAGGSGAAGRDDGTGGKDAGAGGDSGGAPGGTAGLGGAGGAPAGGAASTGGVSTGGNPGECRIPPISDAPVGYGASVTGGGDGLPVEARTMSDLSALLDDYRGSSSGIVIRYTGTFDFSSIADPCDQFTKEEQTVDVKEVSNVTILGAPGSAANFGLHITKSTNVIIRNMTFGLVPGAADAIGIEGESSHIWIDHNEFFSSMVECDGAGDSEFDGLLDVKDGSHHMTFTYNYFHDHHKVGLLGSSDDDAFDWYITFHHNWYDNVGSRTPLQRGGLTHLFNNYYRALDVSGINSRVDAVALVEANHFEDCTNPITSRDSDVIGYWDLRNNQHTGDTWTSSNGDVNADTWTTTASFPEDLGYSYSADPVECVKAIVMATAGARL